MLKKSILVAAMAVAAVAAPLATSANAQSGFGIGPGYGGHGRFVRARWTGTPRINHRIRRQARRIRRGRMTGSLNRFEARRLRAGLRHIQLVRIEAVRDGFVSRFERRRLHRKLDRNSRRIWRLSHNGRRYRGARYDGPNFGGPGRY